MAEIRPFKALHPLPEYADKVAVYTEKISIGEAKQERDRNSLSYIHLLVPDKGETERKDEAFLKIRENLKRFKQDKILMADPEPCFYIIQLSNPTDCFTGLWAATSVEDYTSGRLKRHELIRPEREAQLVNYLQNAGLDGNPVLITYQSDTASEQTIAQLTETSPFLSFETDDWKHELWRIDQPQLIGRLQQVFGRIGNTYIADGHHRAAAAVELAKLGAEKSAEGAGYFSSVYIPSTQIKVHPYHRLVSDLNGLSIQDFLSVVRRSFYIEQLSEFHPFTDGIVMYLHGLWFVIFPKDHILSREGKVANLLVSLLDSCILQPVLGINEASSDRIAYSSDLDINNLVASPDAVSHEIIFFLPALKIEEVMAVADSGEVLPPKSTYILPKFPAGLLVREIPG